MTEPDSVTSPAKPNRRASRPERIDIADDELVRNDVVAREQGTCERTVNRGDARGAPYSFIGGVKYRPIRRYKAWLAAQIKVRGQPPKRRGRR
jgi:hypothetical protein